jgi:hypothetical protein
MAIQAGGNRDHPWRHDLALEPLMASRLLNKEAC